MEVPEVVERHGLQMTRSTFDAMPLDDLWDLHKRVVSILRRGSIRRDGSLNISSRSSAASSAGHLPIQGDADRIRRSSRSFAIPQTQPRPGRAEASSLTGCEIYSPPEQTRRFKGLEDFWV